RTHKAYLAIHAGTYRYESGRDDPGKTVYPSGHLAPGASDAQHPERPDPAQRTGGAETTAGTARVRYDSGLRSAELAGYAANGADHRAGAGCAQSDLHSPRR